MGLFDFFKRPKQIAVPSKADNPLIEQITAIGGMSVEQMNYTQCIRFSELFQAESLPSLLRLLRENRMKFEVYDPIYPTNPADPGAYLSYWSEENEEENTWSMTIGNHGWSGGTYKIEEHTILTQLEDLLQKKLLKEISIRAASASHYAVMNPDSSRNVNSWFLFLHKYQYPVTRPISLNYLVFGLSAGNDPDPYPIYKLTPITLFVDNRATWHQESQTPEGYRFQGCELPAQKFELVKNLLTDYPTELLNRQWPGFATAFNRDEKQLVLELGALDFTKTITIDRSELASRYLPEAVKDYCRMMEGLVPELDR